MLETLIALVAWPNVVLGALALVLLGLVYSSLVYVPNSRVGVRERLWSSNVVPSVLIGGGGKSGNAVDAIAAMVLAGQTAGKALASRPDSQA